MWNRTHPKYNRYENPYASPAPTHDSSVCDDCGGPTGRDGESFLKPVCLNCSEMLLSAYNDYQEEDSSEI